jgi:hypothetical protein
MIVIALVADAYSKLVELFWPYLLLFVIQQINVEYQLCIPQGYFFLSCSKGLHRSQSQT